MEYEKKRGLGVCRNGKRKLHRHPSIMRVNNDFRYVKQYKTWII